jgi:Cu2+-exporting ATPase
MDFQVSHFMPGRLRLHIPALCRKRSLADAFVSWLRAQAGINRARINHECSSLVVEYDVANHKFFEGMLRELQHTPLSELRVIVSLARPSPGATPTDADAAAPKSSPVVSWRAPLALPTLSLLMAFSGNPVVMAVNLPLMLWNGLPIAVRARRVWRRESRLNIDFLDTLAIAASVMQGAPLAGSIVTWLIKLGDWIRDLTAAGARRAITELLEFQSKTAWVVREGEIVSIPARELAVGDVVVIYPGEMISVDGEIIEGRATIDQKTITGESLPVVRGAGDAAFAATVLRDGQLRVRALRVGVNTTGGQIAQLVESAPTGDTRMQNHAERLADRLVLPTLALAVGTAAITRDFNRFLSLIIIDYGTGIRVAAPTSVLASMTHSARAGIIIKSGAHM